MKAIVVGDDGTNDGVDVDVDVDVNAVLIVFLLCLGELGGDLTAVEQEWLEALPKESLVPLLLHR